MQLQHFLSLNKTNIKHSCKLQLYNIKLLNFMKINAHNNLHHKIFFILIELMLSNSYVSCVIGKLAQQALV